MPKYIKTDYPNIYTYQTKAGTTKYRIRKKISFRGSSTIIDESKFKTLAHAKARLRQIEEQADKSEPGYIRNHKLTVEEYYKEYSERKLRKKIWSKDSFASNDSLFKKHIQPVFGKTPLIKLYRPDYEDFIEEKLKTYRYGSVKTIHTMFMAMLNDAVNNGVTERNRFQRIEIGGSKIPAKNKRVSLKDYNLWMDTAKMILSKYAFSIIYLCVYGMRRGEVCGLRSSVVSYDDDPNLATIHIADSRTAHTAKYGKGGVKNPRSDRFIILDAEGTAALQYVINEAKEIKKDYNEILHKDDFILLNPATNEPYHPVQLNRWFEEVSEACGVKISPHMLRHFFATQSAIAGVNKEHVAAYLGHADKTMTEYYTHIQNETAANVVNQVSGRLHGDQK